MRFVFPSATIASISGAAYLASPSATGVAASVGVAYNEPNTGSLRATAPSKGAECSFLNAFKNQAFADMGILCGVGETCVEDKTSFTGGRCVDLAKERIIAEKRRELAAVPCQFKNGTSGIKCDRVYSCSGADPDKIGCGSCIGPNACSGVTGTVGEGSCVGASSCKTPYGNVTIGNGSCLGNEACYNMDATILGSVTIGDNSCHDNVACKYNEGNIGSNSCIGGTAVGVYGDVGYACYYFTGASIGDNSCLSYAACYHNNNGETVEGTVGSNSCQGKSSCYWLDSRKIGDSSCNGNYACTYSTSDVGSCRCNGYQACYKNYGDLSSNGCPTGAPVSAAPVSVAPTKPTAAPTANPTKSPSTKSPTKNPTKSPTKKPTMSPTKKPTKSPTENPTKSPTLAPTITPVTTIQMDASFSWNVTCPLNNTAQVADIIEVSLYQSLETTVDELLSVAVYELCDDQIDLTARRLQQNASSVGAHLVLSTRCNGCGPDIFDNADKALNEILQDGTLNDAIQKNSGGLITAGFDTTYVTSWDEISDPPTKAPTEAPITGRPTPTPFDPESPGDLPTNRPTNMPTNRPTPRPSTGTKSSKDSKTTPPPTHKPTPAPTGAKSTKRVRA